MPLTSQSGPRFGFAFSQEVAKNPRNPSFNHYVFESVAGLVKHACADDPAQCSNFEALLFPPFQHILEMDVQEFAPYVFQILSQVRPGGGCPT